MQQLYTGATATSLSHAYLQPRGAGQPRRRNGAPASHPKFCLESRVPSAVSPSGTKRRSAPLLSNPDPTAACKGLAPRRLSMEGCRHTGITTHSFALELGTILDSWLHSLMLALPESDRILGDSSNFEKLELV